MPLEYSLDGKLKALSPVLREHRVWFGAVLRAAFYPEAAVSIELPGSLLPWLEEIKNEDIFEVERLNHLQEVHDKLHAAGEALVNASSPGSKPDLTLLESLTSLIEDFATRIDELEKECFLEDIGIDVLTGLRSKRALVKDLEKELERFARNGKQFTVAITRIDDYQKILDAFGDEKAKEYVALVASLIKKSMRAFDDAYVFEADKFVLCLKQSEVSGGIAALERLRHELEEENIIINLGDGKLPLTLSCCVAEPLPGDKVDELLKNLSEDLAGACQEPDTVLQYYEVSPLQRYVQTSDE